MHLTTHFWIHLACIFDLLKPAEKVEVNSLSRLNASVCQGFTHKAILTNEAKHVLFLLHLQLMTGKMVCQQ